MMKMTRVYFGVLQFQLSLDRWERRRGRGGEGVVPNFQQSCDLLGRGGGGGGKGEGGGEGGVPTFM